MIGDQLLWSALSVAANYQAVRRARSKAEFIAKLGTVIEEADETVFWLELLVETELVPKSRMGALLAEANELVRIFAAARRKAKTTEGLNRPIAQSPNDPTFPHQKH